MKISVLVSTCNRCDKLRLLLDTIKSAGSDWPTEVIIIDNNSSDATKQVVTEYTSLHCPVFRYLFESKPGKSCALNLGIRQAKGEIIAFTDDDCIPSARWLTSILKEFESDPELSALGGRVELYDERDRPQAIVRSNLRTVVKDARQVCETPAIIGANMAFRKTVLNVVGGFDPLLGPGSVCKAVEDLDLIYRSLRRKFKIVYSPEVIVYHNHSRRTDSDEDKTSVAYALGRGAFYAKYILRLDFRITRIALRELRGLAKTLMKGVITRTKFPYHRLTLPAIFVGAFHYCQARFSWRQLPDQCATGHTLANYVD